MSSRFPKMWRDHRWLEALENSIRDSITLATINPTSRPAVTSSTRHPVRRSSSSICSRFRGYAMATVSVRWTRNMASTHIWQWVTSISAGCSSKSQSACAPSTVVLTSKPARARLNRMTSRKSFVRYYHLDESQPAVKEMYRPEAKIAVMSPASWREDKRHLSPDIAQWRSE